MAFMEYDGPEYHGGIGDIDDPNQTNSVTDDVLKRAKIDGERAFLVMDRLIEMMKARYKRVEDLEADVVWLSNAVQLLGYTAQIRWAHSDGHTKLVPPPAPYMTLLHQMTTAAGRSKEAVNSLTNVSGSADAVGFQIMEDTRDLLNEEPDDVEEERQDA